MFSLLVMGFSISEVHPTLGFRSLNYGFKIYLFIYLNLSLKTVLLEACAHGNFTDLLLFTAKWGKI